MSDLDLRAEAERAASRIVTHDRRRRDDQRTAGERWGSRKLIAAGVASAVCWAGAIYSGHTDPETLLKCAAPLMAWAAVEGGIDAAGRWKR